MAPHINDAFSSAEGAQNCDMILVLSSELVCQLAEQYFNKTMLKQKVSVIELQARPDGLIQFMLAFKAEKVKTPVEDVSNFPFPEQFVPVERELNGRFRRKHQRQRAVETP